MINLVGIEQLNADALSLNAQSSIAIALPMEKLVGHLVNVLDASIRWVKVLVKRNMKTEYVVAQNLDVLKNIASVFKGGTLVVVNAHA